MKYIYLIFLTFTLADLKAQDLEKKLIEISKKNSTSSKVLKSKTITKLQKDLNHMELCAFKVLQKKVLKEAVDPKRVVFYHKVEISYLDTDIVCVTNIVLTQSKLYKNDFNDSIMKATLIIKSKIQDDINKQEEYNKKVKEYGYKGGLTKNANGTGGIKGSSDGSSGGSNDLKKAPIKIKKIILDTVVLDDGYFDFKYIQLAYIDNFSWEISTSINYMNYYPFNANFILKNEKKYKSVSYYNNSFAIVYDSIKYGVVNSKGEIVLPIKYNNIDYINFGLYIKEGEKYYFYDLVKKMKLSKDYEEFQIPYFSKKIKTLIVKRDSKFTILDNNFNEQVPLIYDKISIVGMKSKSIIAARNNKKLLLCNTSYKEISQTYDHISLNYNSDTIFITKNNNKFGILNSRGIEIFEPLFNSVELINIQRKILLAKVKIDSSFALYDIGAKKYLFNFEYQNIENVDEVFICKKNGKYGVLDINGKEIIPFNYHNILVDISSKNTNEIVFKCINDKGVEIRDKEGKL